MRLERHLLASLKSILLITLPFVMGIGLSSNISPKIKYNFDDYYDQYRFHSNHMMKLPAFQIKATDLPANMNTFKLEIRIVQKLRDNAKFYEGNDNNSNLEWTSFNSTHVSLNREGNQDEINEFLINLHLEKTGRLQKDEEFLIEFQVTGKNDMQDILVRHVTLAEKVKTQIISTNNTLNIKPGEGFNKKLALIIEGDKIIKNIEPKISSNIGNRFFKVVLNGSVVMLTGETPYNIEQTQPTDRIVMHIYLYDMVSQDTSDSFTYSLEIVKKPKSNQLTIIFLLLVIGMFSLMIVTCFVILMKKETKREKEQVRTKIQEQKVEQNILTRSILDWPPRTQLNDNSDTSSKNSVLFNPYDKYSLKKNGNLKKKKYDNLEQGSKNYDLDTDRDIEMNSSRKEIPQNPEEMLQTLKKDELNDISALNFSKAVFENDKDKTMGIDFGDVSKIGKLPSMIAPIKEVNDLKTGNKLKNNKDLLKHL